MSVFNDFQRLWMQRFPQSSLSDAWEQDVRASLERHKDKIVELTKELEQEKLYVEYLERLLADVEKFRDSGGDPTTLFEAATTPTTVAAVAAVSLTADSSDNEILEVNAGNNDADEDDVDPCELRNDDAVTSTNVNMTKSSLNLRETTGSNGNKETKNNRLSLNTDNKYASNNNNNNNNNAIVGIRKTSSPTAVASSETNGQQQKSFDKDSGTEKEQQRHNGALQQCISELAAGMKTEKNSTSHFVTVIEVKESKFSGGGSGGGGGSSGSSGACTTVVSNEADNASISQECNVESNNETAAGHRTAFSSFERKTSTKMEATAPPLSPAMNASSSSTSPSMSASSYAAHLEAKKKMPPRPPLKNVRRVEPPTIPGAALSSSPKRDSPFSGSQMPLPSSSGSFSSSDSPANSLERNIKPTDILRQKAEAAETKQAYVTNRKTTPEMCKLKIGPELVEELERKVGKTESLEKTKRSDLGANQSPTSSLGRTVSSPNRSLAPGRSNLNSASPTNSLNKSASKLAAEAASVATSSMEKKARSSLKTEDSSGEARNAAGSKESLASQGISEIIKSYESVSSLGSDSVKAGGLAVDNEPYYDTVPMDNGEGEYVYIKPGGTGSSSSRDDLSTPGSSSATTLPMGSTHGTEPESPGRTTNYVNIDYFIQSQKDARSSSLDSDGEYDGPPIMRTISQDDQTSQTPGALRKVSGNARGAKIRSILNSIIQSETIYVECLNKMLQYKKAINGTLKTSQPVIKEEEQNTIFFKIDELYALHTEFLNELKAIVAHEGGDVLIGETFKRLADNFNLYSTFLHNYGQAIETVKICGANNPQFKQIASTIVVNLQQEQSLTLEDLLHKPVARVQINALVFNDLLNETPINHPDHHPLKQAHKTIHMFLKQFNVVNQGLPTESDKNLRRMVRNSFIVESVDGHRKLRHLFLFNDAIACAKYKASGRDRIEYEMKWCIPLKDIIVYEDTGDCVNDPKDASAFNILQLKTQASTVRDQLMSEEKDGKARKGNGVRAGDKYRRKLADLESQLVLASPNLAFRIGNKATNKNYIFYLSSEYERTLWIESILTSKETCNIPGANAISALKVHAFIVAMQKCMKTEMGSYLMRHTNDESLLIGDLHMTIQGLTGLEQPTNLYICIEVDFYGHYFRKAKTKMICRSTSPLWNESFVLELESSQNVRILLYEEQDRPKLKAKYVLRLSRKWLQETPTPRVIELGETMTLNTTFRFVPGEISLRRVPISKPGALFGAKISQVLKREDRDIPFIITACIREVERRGMSEVGIYRVSGSASDLNKIKKSFETNNYEAEQLLKEIDIHSVTGILKSYLRELPEALFSDQLYPKFSETFGQYSNNNEQARINALLKVFEELPHANKATINHILDHLIRVHHQEVDNKMSLHNLAMVFGPTLLRPGQTQAKQKDLLASSTVDVMAQAGILYCFLQSRVR